MLIGEPVGSSSEINSAPPKVNINSRSFKWLYQPPSIKSHNVKYIFVHHAAARSCSAAQIHDWHLQRTDGGQWAGAGYNFFIRKDGSIWEMRGFNLLGSQAGRDWNPKSMGVCLEGHYDVESSVPTAQWNSLIDMIIVIMNKFPNINYNLANIRPHSDVSAKTCPGTNVSMSKLRRDVKDKLSSYNKSFKNISYVESGARSQGVLSHVMRVGDTLQSVAKKYNTTTTALISLNGPGPFSPGQKIMLLNSPYIRAGDAVSYSSDYVTGMESDAAFSHGEAISDGVVFGAGSGAIGYAYDPVSESFSGITDQSSMLSKPYMSKLDSLEKISYGVSLDRRDNIEPIETLIDYDKFKIMVETDDHVATFMFEIDPLSSSETRSRNLSEIKTKGGSVIVDSGANFPTKNISGIMLWYNGFSEKTDFLNFYKRYIENGNYKSIHLEFQGVLSLVEIKNVSISETGDNAAYGSYNMSIMILAENTGQSGEEYAQKGLLESSDNSSLFPEHIVNSLNRHGSLEVEPTLYPDDHGRLDF